MFTYTLCLILSFFSSLSLGSTAVLPVVQILDSTSQKHLCTGVLIEEKRILTARHCLSSSDARRYSVVHPELQFSSNVDRVHFYESDSRYFPNRDLAILDISTAPEGSIQFPKLESIKITSGMRVSAYGRGYQNTNLDPTDVGSLKILEGRLSKIYQGFRIENLARFETHNKPLCVGDSGGPLLVQKRGTYYLIGWINGLWDPLTESDGQCANEAVVTPMGNYASWIQHPASRSELNTSNLSFPSLEQACRSYNLSSKHDLLIQKILLQLVDAETDRKKKLDMLLQCTGVDPAWQNFIKHGKTLVLDAQTDIRGMLFLHPLKGLELSNITPANIRDLSEFQNLEILSLNGSTQSIDLFELKVKNLKRFSLKNMRKLQGLKSSILRHPSIEDISLLDIQDRDGPISLSWFAQLSYLKRLRIGMASVDRDTTLPTQVSLRIW
jgi:hypothetical protein